MDEAALAHAMRTAHDEHRIELGPVAVNSQELASLLSQLPSRRGCPVIRSIQFEGTTFSERVDLSSVSVLGPFLAVDSDFSNGLDCMGGSFWAEVEFDGCTFDGPASWESARFFSTAAFLECEFIGACTFEAATFKNQVSFSKVDEFRRVEYRDLGAKSRKVMRLPGRTQGSAFRQEASFKKVTCRQGITMRRVLFSGDATFAGARIHGRADWCDAEFGSGASFNGAQFFGDTVLIGTDFLLESLDHPDLFDRSPVTFHRATFHGETNISAHFTGHADFKRCTFFGAAAFTDSTFGRGAQFNGSVFHSDAGFHMASFLPGVDFANTHWMQCCTFTQVHFGPNSRFSSAIFGGGLNCKWAEFEGDVSLEYTEILGELDLSRTTWRGRPSFMQANIQCARVDLRRALFAHYLEVTLRSREIVCDRTRLEGGGHIRLEGTSEISLEECDVLAPTILSSAEDGDQPPRILSLRRSNAAHISVESVGLDSCLFAGAHGLDQIHISGELLLGPAPPGLRTRRQVVREEVVLRRQLKGRRNQAWRELELREPDWLSPEPTSTFAQAAAVYRALRKAREDAKDEPGAGDLYYGEMEMRRLDPRTGATERLLLNLYRLSSGYALRASRAFCLLAIVLALCAAAYAAFGLEASTSTHYETSFANSELQTYPVEEADMDQPSTWETIGTSTLVSLRAGISLLGGGEADLTPAGQVVEIFNRILAPLLLGLALLSLRGRVKR